MPRIGLLSDTHGWLDPRIQAHFSECDEIWHAGDIGGLHVPMRAMWSCAHEGAQKYPALAQNA